jgi:hypothetical protein
MRWVALGAQVLSVAAWGGSDMQGSNATCLLCGNLFK